MHRTWRAISVLTLLSLSSLVQPAPSAYNAALMVRGDGGGDDIPKELQPVLQDDGLPEGEPEDALQDNDYEIDQSILENCPDYDPDQQLGNGQRRLKRATRDGSAKVLRKVYVGGKRYRDGFIASADKRFVAIKAEGPRSRQKFVSVFETSKELPKNSAGKVWEADHVCDLGIFTTIARKDTPKGVKEAAWTKIQDAVFGEKQTNGDPKANDDTKTLGGVLNRPANMRGMSYEMNQVKSLIMSYAFDGKNKPTTWTIGLRRSNVWGTSKQMLRTKKQFDETLTKAAAALKGFIKDDPDSAKAIENLFIDQGQAYYKTASDELGAIVKDPPPDPDDPKKKKSVFKQEDCANVVNTPDDPKPTDSGTTGGPPPGPNPKCHGVSGDTWMYDRNKAIDAATQFCAQANMDQEYFKDDGPAQNKGINDVQLKLSNTDPSKKISDAPDCIGNFRAIIDGCDSNDQLNNPHNFKFGGTYVTNGGWTFTMTPLHKQEADDSCNVSYHFLDDTFDVRGRNLPDSKLGAKGEHLRDGIAGCDNVHLTKWKFEPTPDDVKYQWHASGKIFVGHKGCVGKAILTAGGSTADQCHGSG